MRARTFFIALTAVAVSACAHLPQKPLGPVVADRPGFTDGPTALPVGSIGVESGLTVDRLDATTYVSAGEVLVRAGIASRTELRVFGNSYGVRAVAGAPTVQGLEDVKVGAKVQLLTSSDSSRWIPSLAVLGAVTAPSGHAGIGAGVAQPESKIAASWATGTPVSIYMNAGVSLPADGILRGSMSAALWFAATPKLSFFAERQRVVSIRGLAPAVAFLDGGATWLVTDQIQIDARVGRGTAAGIAGERFFGVGIARRW